LKSMGGNLPKECWGAFSRGREDGLKIDSKVLAMN
jgi:hypothetical protein